MKLNGSSTSACLFSLFLFLAGCQSLPSAQEGRTKGVIFLKGENCVADYIEDLEKVYYGPCLRVTSVNDQTPRLRGDGFIELPVATSTRLEVACISRHQDGSRREDDVSTVNLTVDTQQFRTAGERWYLTVHTVHGSLLHARGCKPVLSRSSGPAG